MKRQSLIILIVCALLAVGLIGSFLLSQGGGKQLTQEDAIALTHSMENALRHKNANGILAYISPAPETRVSGISHDQLHLLLVRYFRNSDHVRGELTNYAFTPGETEATLQFDLKVFNDGSDSRKEDYAGHITLHIRRVEVPHMLGFYKTKEWLVSSAETTGPNLSTFGD